MKFVSALASLALTVGTAEAFTVGPARGHHILSKAAQSTSTLSSPSLSQWNGNRQSVVMMSSASDFAKAEIEGNKIVVFSKSFCPFCKKTKAKLTELGADFKVYELNEMDNGGEIQDALAEMTGQKTVPNIFISGKHIGGNSDLQELAGSGKLQKMI